MVMDRFEYTLDKHGEVVAERKGIGPPRRCPRCGSELEEFRSRRSPGFKPLGIVVFIWPLLGSLLALLFATVHEGSTDDPALVVLFGIWLVVPPLIGAIFMSRMPRLIPLECYTCGWRTEFAVKANRRFDVDEDPG